MLIGSVVIIRAFVLEAHPPPVNVEFYLIIGMWLLTPIVFVSSIIIFLVLAFSKKIDLASQSFEFMCSLFWWTLGGLGIASIIIIAGSAYYASPQGPLSIIFLDGPLGAGVGMIVGFIMWLLRIRGAESSSPRFSDS